MVSEVTAKIFTRHGSEERKIKVVSEVPLTIRLRRKKIATLYCTPVDLEALVVGFLLTEGYMRLNLKDSTLPEVVIENLTAEVDLPLKEVKRTIPKVKSTVKISWKTLMDAMERFGSMSPMYRESRGNHSASLMDEEGRIMLLSEDVGRHNALDKVVGKSILNRIETRGKILLISSRISEEIVKKGAVSGFQVISGFGSPTDSAVRLSELLGMALCWLRGNELRVFGNRDIVY